MNTLTKRQAQQIETIEKRTVYNLEDPATCEASRKLLEAAMLQWLPKGSEDYLTLAVRRGVTHQGYEILLRDRLLTIKTSLVDSAIQHNTLAKLAENYLDRLRSRLFTGQEPAIAKFRVLDVERERLHELQVVLLLAHGADWLEKFIKEKLDAIEAIGVGWARPMRAITKLRLLKDDCANQVIKEMRGDRNA